MKADNLRLTGLGSFAPQPNTRLTESQQAIEALCTIQCFVTSSPCIATGMHCPSLPCIATGVYCHFLISYITRNAGNPRPAAALLDVNTKQTQSGWSTDLFPTQSARHNVAGRFLQYSWMRVRARGLASSLAVRLMWAGRRPQFSGMTTRQRTASLSTAHTSSSFLQ